MTTEATDALLDAVTLGHLRRAATPRDVLEAAGITVGWWQPRPRYPDCWRGVVHLPGQGWVAVTFGPEPTDYTSPAGPALWSASLDRRVEILLAGLRYPAADPVAEFDDVLHAVAATTRPPTPLEGVTSDWHTGAVLTGLLDRLPSDQRQAQETLLALGRPGLMDALARYRGWEYNQETGRGLVPDAQVALGRAKVLRWPWLFEEELHERQFTHDEDEARLLLQWPYETWPDTAPMLLGWLATDEKRPDDSGLKGDLRFAVKGFHRDSGPVTAEDLAAPDWWDPEEFAEDFADLLGSHEPAGGSVQNATA